MIGILTIPGDVECAFSQVVLGLPPRVGPVSARSRGGIFSWIGCYSRFNRTLFSRHVVKGRQEVCDRNYLIFYVEPFRDEVGSGEIPVEQSKHDFFRSGVTVSDLIASVVPSDEKIKDGLGHCLEVG